jgi:outer membrane protein assembly factor BamB
MQKKRSHTKSHRQFPLLLILFISLVFLAGNGASTPVTARQAGDLPNAAEAPQLTYQYYLPTLTVFSDEWTQHAHDAAHTGYAEKAVETPWRWKWSWNGSNSSGGVVANKTSLPKDVQPITGAGRVYIARGASGVVALNQANGAELWVSSPGGSINATPAFDYGSSSLYVTSSNGYVYRLNASNGALIDSFNTQSALSTPPALYQGRIFVSSGNAVYALDKLTMDQIWRYNAASPVQTPPAFSASRDVVVVGTANLNVHAIKNTDGTRLWQVRPTVHSPGDAGVEYTWGWPVIADKNGLVLIKLRLPWDSLWTFGTYPTTNAAIRQNLQSNPGEQALFALSLDNGSLPFISNIGNGGWGDGGNLPMGPQPVVKHFSDGSEVVYTVGRGGGSDAYHEARWDSVFVEMMLNSSTVPGYSAGEIRFIQYNHVVLTDEQPFVSMAGDYLLGGHWMAGYALKITDRSSSRGAWEIPSRIAAVDAPHIVESQAAIGSCSFSTGHYCSQLLTEDGDPRTYPPGFYIYYNAGKVYDSYWSGYSSWVVSNGLILFRSNSGAIVALEHGTPSTNGLEAVEDLSAASQSAVLEGTIDNPGAQDRPAIGAQVIPYTEARSHIGEIKTVQGVVRYLFNNGKSFYLGFQDPHQGAFAALIPVTYLELFPDQPENLFHLEDQVKITGKIVWYQGDPVIYVSDPAQIEFMK